MGDRLCNTLGPLFKAVLRIRDGYPGSIFFPSQILDVGSEFFPSRIRIKEFKHFNPKNGY